MAQTRKTDPGALRTLVIGTAVVASLFFVNVHYPSLLALAELKTFDLRMYTRGTRKPQGEVAIVAIDDKSIVDLGRWPWPRTVFAQLTQALKDYHVAVVGFDLVFSERDDGDNGREKIEGNLKQPGLPADKLRRDGGISNDQIFANAIKEQGTTFVGYPFQIATRPNEQVRPGFATKIATPAPITYNRVLIPAEEPPPPVPEAIAYLPNLPVINGAVRGGGYIDTPTDPDGVFRSEMMVVRFHKHYCEPLILAVTTVYLNNQSTSLILADFGVESVSIGPVTLPVDEQGHMLVNFRGPSHTFPYYSVSDVIAHRVAPQALAGKIVLVGPSATGVGDRCSTPMDAGIPGVEIHANAIDNILTGDFFQRSDVTRGLERWGAVAMGIAVTAAVAFLPAFWSAVVTAALIAGYLAFAQYLLIADGLLLGMLFPMVVAVVDYAVLAGSRLVHLEGQLKAAHRITSPVP